MNLNTRLLSCLIDKTDLKSQAQDLFDNVYKSRYTRVSIQVICFGKSYVVYRCCTHKYSQCTLCTHEIIMRSMTKKRKNHCCVQISTDTIPEYPGRALLCKKYYEVQYLVEHSRQDALMPTDYAVSVPGWGRHGLLLRISSHHCIIMYSLACPSTYEEKYHTDART